MTDKELLGLAAKAAGMKLWNKFGDPVASAWRESSTKTGLLLECGKEIWNPLDDDGDALRLAVKLSISIDQWPNEDGKGGYCSTSDNLIEHHGCDKLAATRRAIVRAAAEIGKAMP